MNEQDNWDKFSDYLLNIDTLGISLDLSQANFSKTKLDSQQQNLTSALKAMWNLEAGAIANPDENRMVGHYWLRNPELAPTAEICSSIKAELTKINSFASNILNGTITSENGLRFEQAVLIGIGGSILGPQLVYDALKPEKNTFKLYFADNTDPAGIHSIWAEILPKLEQTLFIAISKSGATIETSNCLKVFSTLTKQAGFTFAKRAVAITAKNSKLAAQASNWLQIFDLPDWVGGRTSLFSAVGLLPAALTGIDINQLLDGAQEMDVVTRETNCLQNPAIQLALTWLELGNHRGDRSMVVLPYSDRLILISRYLQQLVMESIGKELDLNGKQVHQGLTVYGNKGSTDQHAFMQQLRDGRDDFFVNFIEVLTDPSAATANIEIEPGFTTADFLAGFLLGTRAALAERNRPTITITLDSLNARSLAALIALYERTVGYYAALINVNAYNQPGVEAGKKAAQHVITLQKQIIALLKQKTEFKSAAEIAVLLNTPAETETIYKILDRLSLNPTRCIKQSGMRGPKTSRFGYVE